ncbi:MAG: AAA family ATPase [Acidobacteriaceae bacterium]|nr:AAA family ATPase [Acidobacteriaceae bacterium]
MPLLKLVAEGVGPFERIEIDFSDGQGNPHLGPHIFAGINGSGKSTILRTIAWVLRRKDDGFDSKEWRHSLAGHRDPRACVIMKHPSGILYFQWRSTPGDDETSRDWARAEARSWARAWTQTPAPVSASKDNTAGPIVNPDRYEPSPNGETYALAAYSPVTSLKHIAKPDLNKILSNGNFNALAFQGTVQNEAIQAWLLSLYSKRAIAKERRQATAQYTRSLDRFEAALKSMYGTNIHFDVEIEPFEPRLVINNHSYNFSQLADGVRGTVGWIADFMMRQDSIKWDPDLEEIRPGILLLDEVDVHLHPLWQRRLLPAMRESLPNVQLIVTSHSPFVISSCPGARIHVLQLDAHGHSHNCPPVDSPIGESVLTTLKEIFGVKSRFDIQTEVELDEWNDLKRKEATHALSPEEASRLAELTHILSARSEELRSLVGGPLQIPESVLQQLVENGSHKKRPSSKNASPAPRAKRRR